MNPDQFEELTGTTVTDGRRNRIAANIERSRAKLETKLGYPLDPEKVMQNLYTEQGKLPGDGLFALSIDFDTVTLEPADAVVGAYRLFNYHPADQFLHIDPFSAIHAVKLVRGSVTLRTLDADDFSIVTGRDGVSRFLNVTWPLWRTFGTNGLYGAREYARLAVDADWLWPENDEGDQDIPADLLYVWADHAAWLSDDTRFIKSENRGTRSYTKSETAQPLDDLDNRRTLTNYAGPNGTLGRLPI